MKKLFYALLVLFIATPIMAQSGLTCEDAIPVDSNYVGTVAKAGQYWYTAGTYDLPLHVHFIPSNPSSASLPPELMIDLTCIPGEYADKTVDSLINLVDEFDITFPAEFYMNSAGSGDEVEFDFFIDATYREQLAKFGVTYNVQAYVQVTFYEPGQVTFKPDTVFTSCLNNDTVVLGNPVDVLANDEDKVLLMPYTDWQNDSIQFVWTGDQNATVYMAAGNCDFKASSSDGYVWATYYLEPDKPYKLSNQAIKDAIVQNDGGGIFYAKVISQSIGQLLVEPIPMNAAQGNAKLLEYGKSISLKANDNGLYCFPKSWTATQFIGTSEFITKAFFSNTSEFAASKDDVAVLAAYDFSKVDGVRDLSLSSAEMSVITKKSTDDYVYVRFQCAQPTTITPWNWDASFCADKSTIIKSANRFSIAARSSNTIYRLRYDDWKGYDITIKWAGSAALPTYIADTCAYTLSTTNKRVVKYVSVPKRGSTVLTADVVNSWESRVDADGFLYVRMNPAAQANVTFTSSKPEEVDPVLPDPVYTTVNDTLCFGETYDWEDTTYNETGKYEKTFAAANGADSIVTLNLLVLPEVKPVITDVTIDYGQTYDWNGKTYSQSITDTITLQDAMGCDYLAILKLTVMDKPVSPCVLGSIELKVGDQLTLNLDSAFTIYRVNYAEFAAQDRTLTWTGATDLHTFVAETCTFAVAPYNKYVHVYVPVPAQGETLWTAAQWADLAAFVDEDGYLYLRFLTEKEGVLTVE
jgi:hypothetical protein